LASSLRRSVCDLFRRDSQDEGGAWCCQTKPNVAADGGLCAQRFDWCEEDREGDDDAIRSKTNTNLVGGWAVSIERLQHPNRAKHSTGVQKETWETWRHDSEVSVLVIRISA